MKKLMRAFAAAALLLLAAPAVVRAGNLVGPDVNVNDGFNRFTPRTTPDIAYDRDRDEFLVTWTFEFSQADLDIHARLVGAPVANGERAGIGNDIDVAISSESEDHARVAYGADPSNARYLVVYDRTPPAGGGGRDIAGTFVDTAFGTAATPFTVTAIPGVKDEFPDIAFDDINKQFIVVFQRVSPGSPNADVFAVTVTAAGAVGVPFQLAATTADERRPSIARAPCSRVTSGVTKTAFIVAYEEATTSTAQVDVAALALVTAAGARPAPTASVVLANDPADERLPRVDSQGGTSALCVFQFDFGGGDLDIQGRAVDIDSAGNPVVLGIAPENLAATSSVEELPAIAARRLPGAGPQYLVAFDGHAASFSVRGVFDTFLVEVDATPAVTVIQPSSPFPFPGYVQVNASPGLFGLTPAVCCNKKGASLAGHEDAILGWNEFRNFKRDIVSRQWLPPLGPLVATDGFESGDFTALPWITGGATDWSVAQNATLTGVFSAESGVINDNENTFLEVRLETQGGFVRFLRAVGAEPLNDMARFEIDGVLAGAWAGDLFNVQQEAFRVAAGTHVFRWIYQKDANRRTGIFDGIVLDEVEFPPLVAPAVVTFSATPSAGAAPLNVSFAAQVNGVFTGLIWTFGDGSTGTGISPPHTYVTPGVYTVTLTANGPGGNSTLTRANLVNASGATVTPAPIADFIAGTPTSGRAPLAVSFQGLSSGGTASTFAWDFGDGGSAATQNPTHVYTTGGSFTVSLTIAGPGGVDTETKAAFVNVTTGGLTVKSGSGGGGGGGGCYAAPDGASAGAALPLAALLGMLVLARIARIARRIGRAA